MNGWDYYHHAVGKKMSSIARIAVPSQLNDLCNSRTLREDSSSQCRNSTYRKSPFLIQATALGLDNWFVLVELQLEASRSRTGDLKTFVRAMLSLPALYVDSQHLVRDSDCCFRRRLLKKYAIASVLWMPASSDTESPIWHIQYSKIMTLYGAVGALYLIRA